MKALMISVLCLGLLVTAWGIYDSYSDDKLHGYIYEIENHTLAAVEQGDWQTAEASFSCIADNWHEYKKISAFFFDRKLLNDSDYSIAKAMYYIRAKDVSNAAGELACLKEQFVFLHARESFQIENIL